MATTIGTIKHKKESTQPDDPTQEVSSSEWNDSLKVSGGVNGDLMVRDSSQTDGWGFLTPTVVSVSFNRWKMVTHANLDSNWRSVCWSPELNLFCAVGTSNPYIMTSPDGLNWTARTAPEPASWISVCWSPQLMLFCAVSATGTNRVMTSPNGVTWTSRTAAVQNSWHSVVWCYAAGPGVSFPVSNFCAVSYDGLITNQVMTSPDGITWTARSSAALNQWEILGFHTGVGMNYGALVALADSGTNRGMLSVDGGVTWQSRPVPGASDAAWYAVAAKPGWGFVAMSAAGTGNTLHCVTSDQGFTWTANSGGQANDWRAIEYIPSIDYFLAISSTGRFAVAKAEGPISAGLKPIRWEMAGYAETLSWRALAWAPALNMLVAVGDVGVNGRVMTLEF
jgi:hypothetical protein